MERARRRLRSFGALQGFGYAVAGASHDDLFDESTIVSSYGHAVYVQRDKGKYSADHYGRAVEYDGTDTNGREAREGLTFEGPGLQEEDGWFYI